MLNKKLLAVVISTSFYVRPTEEQLVDLYWQPWCTETTYLLTPFDYVEYFRALSDVTAVREYDSYIDDSDKVALQTWRRTK